MSLCCACKQISFPPYIDDALKKQHWKKFKYLKIKLYTKVTKRLQWKKIGKGYRIKNSWFPKRIFYTLFYEILDKKQLLFWIMQVNEFRMEWSRKLNLSGWLNMVNLWCFSVLFKESCKKKNEFSKRPSRCQWIILIKIWYEKDMIMEICFVIACSCRVCTQNYCKLTNYSKSLQNGLLINKPILLIEIENCPLSRVLFSFSVQSDSVFF